MRSRHDESKADVIRRIRAMIDNAEASTSPETYRSQLAFIQSSLTAAAGLSQCDQELDLRYPRQSNIIPLPSRQYT